MRPQQWETFKKAAFRQPLDDIPMAMIIDSPWIPGYLGINHLDFFLDPEVWFKANQKIMEQFPEVIFFPSWWMEYGMAIEPSAMGALIRWWQDAPPSEQHMLQNLADVEQFKPVDPHTDGMMPLALHRYKMAKQRIFDAGYTIPVATARGPLCVASFMRGVSEFMMDLIDNPEGVHKLLKYVTDGIISWLKAQAEVIGDSVEGIFILDDIVGFIGPDQYQEFAHPYLKQICDAFPDDWVKVYHNDANLDPNLEGVAQTGFNVLNWGKNLDIADVKKRVGDKLVLMGNVNPLEIAVRGTAEEVKKATLEVIEKVAGEGIILSVGGGVSTGMPEENMRAMIDALQEYNQRS
jgi:MtaA/CmuA family methyltransferase